MKKALILHWWEWTSESHWFLWLAKQLELQWYETIVPDLPGTEFPVLEEQVDFLDQFSLGQGDLIVGHSLGCQVWLKYIEEQKLNNIKVIFVAPSYNYLADELGDDRLGDAFVCMSNAFNTENNFRQINKLWNSYVVMLSDDDPYINSFNAKQFYGQLDKNSFVDFSKKWHFGVDSWVIEFPELLQYL